MLNKLSFEPLMHLDPSFITHISKPSLSASHAQNNTDDDSPATGGESLHEQHADTGAYLLCFLVVLGDVSIFMQTKDLWAGVERQGADVVNVALVRALWGGIVQAAWRKPVRRQNSALR